MEAAMQNLAVNLLLPFAQNPGFNATGNTLLLQIRQKLSLCGNQNGFMLNESSTLLSQKFHELYCGFDFWKLLRKLIYFLSLTILYDHSTFPSLPNGFLQCRTRDDCLTALTANKLVSSLLFFEQGWQHRDPVGLGEGLQRLCEL